MLLAAYHLLELIKKQLTHAIFFFFHCDVLVRGLSLSGLHKQTGPRRNQRPQKAQTCLMQTWSAALCHCQQDGKTTTVVSAADEGGPAAHSL